MAANNKKKSAGSNVTVEQKGLDETQAKPYEPILSSEQRLVLARIYQVILSWRRERLMKAVPVTAADDTNIVSTPSVPAVAVEVEA